MNKAPIYPYPVTYARENGELEQYRASFKTLAECKPLTMPSLIIGMG